MLSVLIQFSPNRQQSIKSANVSRTNSPIEVEDSFAEQTPKNTSKSNFLSTTSIQNHIFGSFERLVLQYF